MKSRQLQFWLLQTGAWLGYGIETYLAALGQGRPVGYYKLALFDSVCGFGSRFYFTIPALDD